MPTIARILVPVLFSLVLNASSWGTELDRGVPLSASVQQCSDAANEPERLLLSTATLPISPTPLGAIPSPPPLDAATGLAVEVFVLSGLALSCFLWLRRRRSWSTARTAPSGGVYAQSAQASSVHPAVKVGAAVFFLLLAAEQCYRGWVVSSLSAQATAGIHAGNYASTMTTLDDLERSLESSWLGFLTPGIDTAFERIDLDPQRDAVGVSAISAALDEGDVERLRRIVANFDPVSPLAITGANAGLSTLADLALRAGDDEEAYRLLERGLAHDSSRSDSRQNACAARYHYAVASIEAGNSERAAEIAEAIDRSACEISPHDRAVLRGFVARAAAASRLGGDVADPEAAVAETEKAYRYMAEQQVSVPFVICDYAASLEPWSVVLLVSDRPRDAVDVLDLTEELVPGREFVARALPDALLELGTKRLAEQNYPEAVGALERGYTETEGRHSAILDALVLAHYSSGAAALESRSYDAAIESLRRALELAPGSAEIAVSLADVHIQRGDQFLKRGHRTRAGADFRQAALTSAQRERHAGMRLDLMAGTDRRFAALGAAPAFLRAPAFQGEVVYDPDNDGRADGILLFQPERETAVALMQQGPSGLPAEVLVLDENDQVVTAFKDNDRDGQLDERLDYSGNELQQLIVDSDSDALPDVRINYGDFGERVTYLSGKVLMRFRSGVIKDQVDPFNSADAYVKVFRNNRYLGRTETVVNTQFPSWRRGVVVDYRYGDRLFLELWDEDLIFDDEIDTFQFSGFPTSSVIKMKRERAALELDVHPTDLPNGHQILFDSPDVDRNIFRDNPTAVPSAAHLIAGAHRARKQAAFNREVAEWAIMTTLVPRLLPVKNPVDRYFRDLIVENMILEPAFGDE